MPACGYEFYLLVFNSISHCSLRSLLRYRVEHSKIKFVSTRGRVKSSIYYIDTSVLLENTPLVKFMRNHIRDSSGVFSISLLVKILSLKLYQEP